MADREIRQARQLEAIARRDAAAAAAVATEAAEADMSPGVSEAVQVPSPLPLLF
jgi:hypothetical protein